jgi:hypothetical protein
MDTSPRGGIPTVESTPECPSPLGGLGGDGYVSGHAADSDHKENSSGSRLAPDGAGVDKRGGGPVTVAVHGQLATLLADDARTK